MCIVVDPPAFVPMLKPSDPEHLDFLPVNNWVTNGAGKFIMGGSDYYKELYRISSVLQLLSEFEKRGKIIRVSTVEVDRAVLAVKVIEPRTDFDDPHLVALIKITGCRLVCVRDARAHKYLKDAKFYSSSSLRPRLYTTARNANILCERNIPTCYK